MTIRHRRRSVQAEAVAPWVALSVVLLVWWAGAMALNWARPGHRSPLMSFGARADPDVPKARPIDEVPPDPALSTRDATPTIAPNTMVFGSDLENLRGKSLLIPVRGLDADKLVSSFDDARGRRRHEAIDILAPRGTDVLAVEDGEVAKIFTSAAGGLTVYQFDPLRRYAYYYAHLSRYADSLKEGQDVARGEIIGFVGISGNAPPDTPHLHFAIFELGPEQQWWKGTPVDPYLVWRPQAE